MTMLEPTKIVGFTTINDSDKPYTQVPSFYSLLEARLSALENLVALLRDELYAMRDEPTDAEIEDMAAYIDELDPDGWIGGTESERD